MSSQSETKLGLVSIFSMLKNEAKHLSDAAGSSCYFYKVFAENKMIPKMMTHQQLIPNIHSVKEFYS